MADRHQYSKPPLVEAVIELRFDRPLSDRDMTRAKDRLQRAYPAVDDIRNFQAKLEAQGAVQDLGTIGYKLTATNGADIVLVNSNALVTSRLAPYQGWNRLIEKTQENYSIFEKIVGFRQIVRIGARFINRIDVPNGLLANRSLGDLFNIKISLPQEMASSQGAFSLAINFVHTGSRLKVLAQIATGEPALIDHASVFVDLDCAIDDHIPPNIGRVWTLLETMRDPKDDIFEGLLTPQVRKLFQ